MICVWFAVGHQSTFAHCFHRAVAPRVHVDMYTLGHDGCCTCLTESPRIDTAPAHNRTKTAQITAQHTEDRVNIARLHTHTQSTFNATVTNASRVHKLPSAAMTCIGVHGFCV